MFRFLTCISIIVSLALLSASSALAHYSGLSVSSECVQGAYKLTWRVGPTDYLDRVPKIDASNNAAIPVGTTLTATNVDFVQTVAGNTVGQQSATITVRWNNGVTQVKTASITLDGKCAPPPPPQTCPTGYVSAGVVNGVLLCTKTDTVTVTVTVEKPVEKVVYVDKPVEKIVYVDKPVEKIVYKTKIRTVVKNKIKTVYRYKIKTIYKTKKCQTGLVLYKGNCAAPGSG